MERGANTAQTEWGRGVYYVAYYGTGLSNPELDFWLSIVHTMDKRVPEAGISAGTCSKIECATLQASQQTN